MRDPKRACFPVPDPEGRQSMRQSLLEATPSLAGWELCPLASLPDSFKARDLDVNSGITFINWEVLGRPVYLFMYLLNKLLHSPNYVPGTLWNTRKWKKQNPVSTFKEPIV